MQKANELRIYAVLWCYFACIWIQKYECLICLNDATLNFSL